MPVENMVTARKVVIDLDRELIVKAVRRRVEPEAGRIQVVADIEVIRVRQ